MLHIRKKADAGSTVARDVLLELANEYEYRGEVKPAPLAAFQMDYNYGFISSQRGRDDTDNSLRNIAIASMVWELCANFRLKPRRGPSRRHPSGCSILGRRAGVRRP
jgi:hypothetical protein